MAKPTPTQRAVMEAMRDGGRLCRRAKARGWKWYVDGGERTVPVASVTANRLVAARYVAWSGASYSCGLGSIHYYTLTPSGKAALKGESP